jgi:hypothetical protein
MENLKVIPYYLVMMKGASQITGANGLLIKGVRTSKRPFGKKR